jgi:ABC-type methionine transport system ATPase subunit
MTVYENIAFVLRVIDAPIKYIRKRVPYVISLVGLHAKTNSYPDELSGGEKQRVAIARALVNDPQLIIADEPTGNIDPELSYEIVELLKGINDQGTTILMVTHEHDLVRHFGGRIINITEGEIVFDEVITGTGDEMLADMDTEMPAEAMAATISETEHINDTAEDVNTEDAINLPIENMTADDIISAIGGTPEPAEKPEGKLMKPLAENIDIDLSAENPVAGAATPEELLAAITEKTEGGAE